MSALYGMVSYGGAVLPEQAATLSDLSRSSFADRRFKAAPAAAVLLGWEHQFFTPESPQDQIQYADFPHLWVTAICRLDNREALLAQLGISDPHAPDTLILCHAYARWGHACSRWLLGDFLVVIWDARVQGLFVAASPFCNRALYMYAHSEGVIYASSFSALRALCPVSLRLNREKVVDVLLLKNERVSETFYQEIRHVLAGQSLCVQDGQVKTVSTWSLSDLPISSIRYSDERDYYDHFREVFSRAVQRCLRTDYPVAAQMSGGLDSPSVASLAAAQLNARGQRLTAFASVPGQETLLPRSPHFSYDETSLIESMADHCDGLDVCFVFQNESRFLLHEALDLYVGEMGVPTRNVHNIGWLMDIHQLAQASGRRGVLSASMGNATISWGGQ